ncbi:hypothetical protein [Pseudolysinimonas yzui]|uniref:Uncharacterized protein n=1 Tax=Pseudolysinimonas yzui TaxID=2708254 RepID=A0A8J3GSC9_9MICO|nr:hypothetical protein [Pseudolysinimonas yzui]GHF22632.1 hypothetical protein GCM10011600_24710 [Pseudolysinimonas yzui]
MSEPETMTERQQPIPKALGRVFGHIDFWRALIAQIFGTLVGGFFAVQVALGVNGLTRFDGWTTVGRVAFIVGVVVVSLGLLLGFAIGMSVVLRPITLKLKHTYWRRLLWELFLILIPIGGSLLLVTVALREVIEWTFTW